MKYKDKGVQAMAGKIKFPLRMTDGTQVRTIEELREHFDLVSVLEYYGNGRLMEWLESRYYDDESAKIKKLDPMSPDFKKKLCLVLGVNYSESEAAQVDLEDISKKNERREKLKKYTADDAILSDVSSVAFTQVELTKLIEKGCKKIYLCGESFIIPGEKSGFTYIGVNNPKVDIEGIVAKVNIDFQSVEINIDNYISIENTDDAHNVFDEFCSGFNNDETIVAMLRPLAEKGVVKAQLFLGMCFFWGRGVKENEDESAKWCRKAAEQGYAPAQYELGYYYNFGRGVDEDYEKSAAWYRKASEQGYAVAQCRLGYAYSSGEGVERNDKEAVVWYRKAADQGNAEAMSALGNCYDQGVGVQEDCKEALTWYKKAAEQGDADAQYWLGDLYYNCYYRYRYYGIKKSYVEAVKWYKKAAEQGHEDAQYCLGSCYFGGDGVEKDYEEAKKWLIKAANQGSKNAEGLLHQIKENI